MKIECYTITYNEELIIPFFINHYRKFCDKIYIFDNFSNDRTIDIINSYNDPSLIVQFYDSSNTLNDSLYLDIKNHCWKNSDADYVIVVDCDELLYHKNIKVFLENNQHSCFKPCGYDMVTDTFPNCEYITDVVKEGIQFENYSKTCIFNPSLIKEINYSLGCHSSNPIDKNDNRVIPYDTNNELKLLHYKNISFDYRFNKHQQYMKRLSKYNLDTGSGIHYLYERDKQLMEFNHIYNNKKKVI